MDAVDVLRTADWKVEHNEITLGEYGEMIRPLTNVIPIPHGATNGDMIKALYPQYEIAIDDILGTVTLFVIENGSAWLMNYDLDWWNAPYKLQEREK